MPGGVGVDDSCSAKFLHVELMNQIPYNRILLHFVSLWWHSRTITIIITWDPERLEVGIRYAALNYPRVRVRQRV